MINRHTLVNNNFKNSWFAVQRPGTEEEAMGDYLPYALNLKEKARFEALGCPVDRSKLLSMLPKWCPSRWCSRRRCPSPPWARSCGASCARRFDSILDISRNPHERMYP